MIFIELILSGWTLLTIWMITNHHHKWGVPLALGTQFCWIGMWLYTGQYGFLLIDFGMIAIYSESLYRRFKRWNEFACHSPADPCDCKNEDMPN